MGKFVSKYKKYFVYLDDGHSVIKVAVSAATKDAARTLCQGNGEVVAVKEVTKEYPISADKVRAALIAARFGGPETDFVCRALEELGITE